MLKKIFIVFKVVVILNLLICLIKREWAATFICLFNFILFFISDYIQNKLKYSDLFQLLLYLFLIGSLLGGEVYYLYTKISYFDIILHTLSSFIVSGLFIYIWKIWECNINRFLFMVCIFSFAMMVAGLWEITEYSIDSLLDKDMQKDTVIGEINSYLLSSDGESIVNVKVNDMSIGNYNFDGYLDIGLYDTMEDMICAVVGSLLFIVWVKIKEAF